MQRAAPIQKSAPHKILPVVTRVIEQLDKLFIELSGSSGQSRKERVFQQWLSSGKASPSGLRHYINALGDQLEDRKIRDEFSARAQRILLHLQSGYVS
ncbi:MAG TPA: hypothetical protein VIM59_16520 [Cellvibrio sp.]